MVDLKTTEAPDFTVRDEGTIVVFTPLTERAKTWLNDNVTAEEWQWLGGGLCVEHRYSGNLLQGIRDSGFNVVCS